VQELASGALGGVGAAIATALQKLTGQSIDPAMIEKIVAQVTAEQTSPAKADGKGSMPASEVVSRGAPPPQRPEKKV